MHDLKKDGVPWDFEDEAMHCRDCYYFTECPGDECEWGVCDTTQVDAFGECRFVDGGDRACDRFVLWSEGRNL